MHELRLSTAAVGWAFFVGLVVVPAAFGLLPTFLPAGTTASPVKLEGVGREGVFETSKELAIKCSAVEVLAELNSPQLGTFHLHFTGCVGPLGEKCDTGGDAAGVILALGSFHAVFDTLVTLGVGLLLILEELHITCLGIIGNVLEILMGAILGLIKPINSKAKTFELIYEQAKGVQRERQYFNDAGRTILTSWLTSTAGGAFEETGWENGPSIRTILHPAGTLVESTVDG